jgi:putative copper resistance protein D
MNGSALLAAATAGEAVGIALALGALAFPASALPFRGSARRLAAAGLLLYLAGGLGRLALPLRGTETEGFAAVLSGLGFLLTATRFGAALGAGLAAALLALAALAREARRSGLLLSLGAALALALTSHAAAREGAAGAMLAFAHITGGGLWLGEIPLLFALLRGSPEAALPTLRLFSRRALFMVAAVAGSGAVLGLFLSGLAQGRWAALGTAYGALLLAKTLLFALLLALAAENRLVLLPRLAKGEREAAARLARNLGLALALGLALLLLAGTLATTAPPSSS